MGTKIKYYTPTAAVDGEATITAWEAEADIDTCVVIGRVGETDTGPIVAGGTLVQPNMQIFKVLTDDLLDEATCNTALSDAATAVGSMEEASGYPTDEYTA